MHVCDGRSSESVSEVRNVLHAKAHGAFKTERVAVNPARPYWARRYAGFHCSLFRNTTTCSL
jgi:hypothetical protein